MNSILAKLGEEILTSYDPLPFDLIMDALGIHPIDINKTYIFKNANYTLKDLCLCGYCQNVFQFKNRPVISFSCSIRNFFLQKSLSN